METSNKGFIDGKVDFRHLKFFLLQSPRNFELSVLTSLFIAKVWKAMLRDCNIDEKALP